MKYYLRSNDKELNTAIHSDAFVRNNDMPFSTEHDLGIGDNLYFVDAYYFQVPMKIVGRTYSSDRVFLTVEKISIKEIDSYIYGDKFVDDVLDALVSPFVKNQIDRYIKDEGDFTSDEAKVHKYAYYIYRYLPIDSPIDSWNIIEEIKKIISMKLHVKYHRPQPWEFSEF